MKLRKISLLLTVLVIIAAIYVPVYAETKVELSKTLDVNVGAFQGWSDTEANAACTLKASELIAAKYMVLEFSKPLEGEMIMSWQSDTAGWNQYDSANIITADYVGKTTLVLEMATLPKYDIFKKSSAIKMYFGNWGVADFATWGFTGAYLTDTAPAAAEAPAAEATTAEATTAEANPKTGDNGIIYVGVFMMALAAFGAVTFLKKAKAVN